MARLLILLSVALTMPAAAQNLGAHGQTYPVQEPDMIEMIERKAKAFVDSGRYEKWKNESIERAGGTFLSPPASIVTKATTRRDRSFDPTYVVPEDITGATGQVLVGAGTRFNPLDYQPPIQPLLFFDSRDPAQVAWAERIIEAEGGKAVLTAGEWTELSRRWGKRVFFDMGGWITRRFGIEAVPAVIRQTGRLLTITEEPPLAEGGQQ
ncbi:MAG: type-F conjugative transfer system protein TraW [Opitutaceae bacterium]|nr:type-F conjugative transfer system protein TraW [Opitutaceae bacterium]